MKLTRRDRFATVLVATAALVYVLWLLGVGSADVTGVRTVASIVLALGFVASASAVVPGFDGLVHGSKTYLVGTSLMGLGALVSGVGALVTGETLALGLLTAATVLLWVVSTARHATVAHGSPSTPGPSPIPG
jgi:hypothetical protein